MRFLGNIEAKVDAKGRVFLPAAFRKVMQSSGEEQVVVRKDVFQDCLVIYPESVWNEQVDALRSRLNRWNKQHQQIYRQFVSDVEVVTLDASGRMLLSRRALEKVGIQSQVCFLGVGDTIEVWPSDGASAPYMDEQEFGKALEGLMGASFADAPLTVWRVTYDARQSEKYKGLIAKVLGLFSKQQNN